MSDVIIKNCEWRRYDKFPKDSQNVKQQKGIHYLVLDDNNNSIQPDIKEAVSSTLAAFRKKQSQDILTSNFSCYIFHLIFLCT